MRSTPVESVLAGFKSTTVGLRLDMDKYAAEQGWEFQNHYGWIET